MVSIIKREKKQKIQIQNKNNKIRDGFSFDRKFVVAGAFFSYTFIVTSSFPSFTTKYPSNENERSFVV